MTTFNYMIHRFEAAAIFGDSEEYEEFTHKASMQKRLNWLVAQDDGFEYWAEDAEGNVYNAIGDEPCGYCGDSQDPNDMCSTCYVNMVGEEEPNTPTHTAHCHEYWDRGLDCQCIPAGVQQDIRNGANPEDVM